MNFQYTNNYHIAPGMFQASAVNAYSILTGRPYMDIFSELEFMARNKFGIRIKDSKTISIELFQEYLTAKKFYFMQVLDKSQKPILKMTEQDLPEGFNFIALCAVHGTAKGHAVAVIDGTIHDQLDVSGKPLLGIFFHMRDGSSMNQKWKRLMEVYDKIDMSFLDKNLSGPIVEIGPEKLLTVL